MQYLSGNFSDTMNNKSALLLTLLSGISLCGYCYAEPATIHFAYIGGETDPAFLGARQGLTEANLQGRFLGRDYTLDVLATEEWRQRDLSKFIGILTAGDIDQLSAIGDMYPDTPVFNLSVQDTSLRAACRRNLLHIIPSRKMLDDAAAQWHQKNPGSSATAQAWHPNFVKFAARDLNKRFLKNQGAAMDDHAWAGWAAIKMTSDTVARESITRAEDMLEYLRTRLSFDGQKGSSMNFRITGQLRQLLLLVENNVLVGEAPVRGIARPPGLDSLGLLNCEK